MSEAPRIGYVLKEFPVVSETFILNEIRAVEGHGVSLGVFALKSTRPSVRHRAVGEVEAPVRRSPSGRMTRVPALVWHHVALLARHPAGYGAVASRLLYRPLLELLRSPSRANRRVLRKRSRRLAWVGWVAHEAERNGLQHLHAHYAGEPVRVAHLVKKLVGIPYSFTAHAKDLFTTPKSRLARHIRSARFVVSCHQHGEEHLKGVAPECSDKIFKILHGVETGLFQASRSEPESTPLVLAVGRLTAKKGFDDLIAACSELRDLGIRFRCEILGEGVLRKRLQQLIAENHLEDVAQIRGFVPHEELPREYARAAMLVLPARVLDDGNRDGIPNVVVEAMAAGVPVVASSVGGIPEVVEDGKTGLLVPPDQPAVLARAIVSLLGDSERVRRLSNEARSRSARFDFRETNRPLVELLERASSLQARKALTLADTTAWEDGGMAAKAEKVLGRAPIRRRGVEQTIRRSVEPGIRANSWRPDLERLATRRMWDEVVKGKRTAQIRSALNGNGGRSARILDLGSGRGGLAVALRAGGNDVVALDLRFRNCRVTRLRGQRYDLEVPSVTSVGESLPFADATFDSVCCLEVLEHVRDPVLLLREIRRVLVPRGNCALTVINRWAHFDPHYHLWGINFLPRSVANRYIAFRGRTKESFRDVQTLDEMHYYRWGQFLGLAERYDLAVVDLEEPRTWLARTAHRLRRRSSLGFNSAMVVLQAGGEELAAEA